jgi:hypothetical protein
MFNTDSTHICTRTFSSQLGVDPTRVQRQEYKALTLEPEDYNALVNTASIGAMFTHSMWNLAFDIVTAAFVAE